MTTAEILARAVRAAAVRYVRHVTPWDSLPEVAHRKYLREAERHVEALREAGYVIVPMSETEG